MQVHQIKDRIPQQRLFALEMMVQGAFPHARGLGHFIHLGAMEPASAKDVERGPQNLLLALAESPLAPALRRCIIPAFLGTGLGTNGVPFHGTFLRHRFHPPPRAVSGPLCA